jgi:hypothetical protein
VVLLFFQLYLAHLVADFLLQPDWVVRRKTGIRPLAAHAAIHLVCAAAAVNLGLDRRVAGAIVGIALIHTLLDYAKARLSGDGWIAFTADQAAHVLVVALASIWLTGSWPGTIDVIRSVVTSPHVYLYACAYVAVVFGGGTWSRRSRNPFSPRCRATWLSRSLVSRMPGNISDGWSAF